MNARTPAALPTEEHDRRRNLRARIDGMRSFNADTTLANERWREIYVNHLPRRFRYVTPAEIVDAVMTRNET